MRVHDVVDLVTSEAPPLRHTADDVIRSGRRAQRRRRAAWTTGSAAVLAVVAMATTVDLPPPPAPSGPIVTPPPAATSSLAFAPPPAPSSVSWPVPEQPFMFTFEGFQVGRFHVQNPVVVSRAYEIAPMYVDGRTPNGAHSLFAYLTVYRPGAFSPRKLAGAQEVSVAGRPGLLTSGPDATRNLTHRVLAWKYVDEAWAVLDSVSGDTADPSPGDLMTVAAGLAPTEPEDAQVPFRMDYVPAGYRPVEVGSRAVPGLGGIARADDGDYGGVRFVRPAADVTGLTEPYGGAADADLPGSFEIVVLPNENSDQPLPDGAEPPAEPRCGNGTCRAWTSDGFVTVQVDSAGRLSDREMTRILKGIQVADVRDRLTWTEADTAIPVRP